MRVVVPRFADWCVADVHDGDGSRGDHRVAGAHADPARLPALREVERLQAIALAPHAPVTTVLRTRAPLLLTAQAPDDVRRYASPSPPRWPCRAP